MINKWLFGHNYSSVILIKKIWEREGWIIRTNMRKRYLELESNLKPSHCKKDALSTELFPNDTIRIIFGRKYGWKIVEFEFIFVAFSWFYLSLIFRVSYVLNWVGWLVVGFKVDCLTRDLSLWVPSVGVMFFGFSRSQNV